MSLIEIKNLRKEYSDAVPLQDVNLNVEEGEIISIIGPSGTGKSTLLRCINRLETPTSGSIQVDGANVCDAGTDLASVRRKMGMVFQSFNLFGHKTAVENVMMPQQDLLGTSAKDAYAEAMEQLRRVGLESKARKFPHELSGGQKQRVAIARALAMHPKIMLFDEPTSALDPTMVSEVTSVIRDLAGTGLTMLIVTHEMRLARDVSTRVLFMSDGGICEEGTPDAIFHHPESEKTREFVFRIRSFTYSFTNEEHDLYELLAGVESFCTRQMIGGKAANKCRLVTEELAVSYLVPAVEREKGKSLSFCLRAAEEGGEITIEIDHSALLQDPFSANINAVSQALLKRSVQRIHDTPQGIAKFQLL